MNKKLKTANEKFLLGDSISDSELNLLIDFYSQLEESLKFLGERFHFAWKDVYLNLLILKSYRESRQK